jgi:hypothetical protein
MIKSSRKLAGGSPPKSGCPPRMSLEILRAVARSSAKIRITRMYPFQELKVRRVAIMLNALKCRIDYRRTEDLPCAVDKNRSANITYVSPPTVVGLNRNNQRTPLPPPGEIGIRNFFPLFVFTHIAHTLSYTLNSCVTRNHPSPLHTQQCSQMPETDSAHSHAWHNAERHTEPNK